MIYVDVYTPLDDRVAHHLEKHPALEYELHYELVAVFRRHTRIRVIRGRPVQALDLVGGPVGRAFIHGFGGGAALLHRHADAETPIQLEAGPELQ